MSELNGNQKAITIKQSATLQGVAVLLMIYHHFYNDPAIFDGKLAFWNMDFVMHLAWFGKICVGIFCFVSGYGMCRVLQKREREEGQAESPWRELWRGLCLCFTKIINLLLRYWIVLIVCTVFFTALGKWEFHVKEFMLNFFCVETTYNGAFWYVEQYVKMLLALPFLHVFFNGFQRIFKGEKGRYVSNWWILYGGILGCILAPVITGIFVKEIRLGLSFFAESMRPAFFLVFIVGYFMARYEWFSRVYDLGKKRMAGWLSVLIGMFLILIVLIVRIRLAASASYATLDFLFVPLFALGFLWMTEPAAPAVKCFSWLGERSVYLWLLHLFVYDLTKDLLLKVNMGHLPFYLVEVLLCAGLGALCLLIDREVCKRVKSL